jgi:hypothetical protein
MSNPQPGDRRPLRSRRQPRVVDAGSQRVPLAPLMFVRFYSWPSYSAIGHDGAIYTVTTPDMGCRDNPFALFVDDVIVSDEYRSRKAAMEHAQRLADAAWKEQYDACRR